MTGDGLVPVPGRLARRRNAMLGDLLPTTPHRFLDEPGAQLELPQLENAGTLFALGDDGDWHSLGPASGSIRVPLARPLRYANAPGSLQEETLEAVVSVRQLVALSLTGPAVDERAAAIVSPCQQVRSLELRFTSLTSLDLHEMTAQPALQELELQGLPAGLNLRRATELRRLRLLHGASVPEFPALNHLQELVLHDLPLTADRLGEMPRLLALDLSRTHADDRLVDSLTESPLLESLNLAQTAITAAALTTLGAMASLVNLDLRGTAVAGEGLRDLANLPRLRGLDLSLTTSSPNQLSTLGDLGQLRVLRLRSTTLDRPTLERIVSGNPHLHVLDVSNCRIDDQAVPALLGLADLRQLGVGGTQMTRQGLAALHAANPELQFG